MLKVAYSTKEIAALLGVTRQAVEYYTKRGEWVSQARCGRGGGSEWLLHSMPQDVQLAIRTAEEKKALAVCEGVITPSPLLPRIANGAERGLALDEGRKRKAVTKADLVHLYLQWQKRHGATVVEKAAFVEAYMNGTWPELLEALGRQVSWKSLERWKVRQSRAGSVLALADKRGLAHKGRSLLSEQHKLIILGQFLNPNAPNIAQCARKVQERCKYEGLYEPSDATIRRFLEAYMAESYDEYILWREGKKAWNDKCAISLLRDWNLVQVGDIVIADGHTLNFETIDPDTGKAKRMTLLLFYDGASNHPLGWEVMATENVDCISSAFRRTCIVLGKIPRVVYIDNGKAFRAKFFEHVPDFEQAGIMGLYASLGCEVIHAWPYHGQAKTIERFFGTFHDMEVFVPSYTGNSIAAKPPRMKRGEVMHRKLYDALGGRPLTLEETHTLIAKWFCEYVERPQYKTHLAGHTPAEIFQSGVGPGVDPRRLTLLMLRKEIKTISKDGIKHRGRYYWDEALAPRRHPVVINYDDLLSPYSVLVYDTDGNFICEARDREHYKIAAGLHPAARVLGSEAQVKALSEAIELKRGQEKLAGANMQIMLDEVIKPEALRRQAALLEISARNEAVAGLSLALPAQERKMTAEEVAAVEAAKARARAEMNTREADKNGYQPAATQYFKDEMAKYEYLFMARYERGVALVAQDAAWMEQFETGDKYQKYMKARYEPLRELYERRRVAV